MDIKDYEGKNPVMLPEKFLVGSLEGWGVLEGPLGGLKARYTIKATGTWDEASSTVTFIETWTFDYGQVETLRWSIRKRSEGAYEGKEPKVDGVAVGEQAGFVYHWSYTRDTPQQDGSSVTLNFDDSTSSMIAPASCAARPADWGCRLRSPTSPTENSSSGREAGSPSFRWTRLRHSNGPSYQDW